MRYLRAGLAAKLVRYFRAKKSPPASVRQRPPRAMPAAQALPGANPHAAWGGRPGRPPAGAALLGAWTAPPVRPFALRSRCSLRTHLRCVCGPRAAARLVKTYPAFGLRPHSRLPLAPWARGGPRRGSSFLPTARHRGGGASPPNDDRRAGARLAPLTAVACRRPSPVSASSLAPPRPSAWPRAVCSGRAAPASRLPECADWSSRRLSTATRGT